MTLPYNSVAKLFAKFKFIEQSAKPVIPRRAKPDVGISCYGDW